MTEKIDIIDLKKEMRQLGSDWRCANQDSLTIKMRFKGFAQAQQHANLAAFISEQLNHHADISFGWGYCHLRITTHIVGGLSALDFEFARRFDIARAGYVHPENIRPENVH